MIFDGMAHSDDATPVIEHYAMTRACQGERDSGDVALVGERQGWMLIAVVDVLGHGPEAHENAVRAQHFLETFDTPDPLACLDGLDKVMAIGRGAAAGIAIVRTPSLDMSYASVGNTAACIFGRSYHQFASQPGTLGAMRRRPFVEQAKLTAGSHLVLFTDGIQSIVGGHGFVIGRQETAAAIARRILRVFGKPHDDASCAVLRITSMPSASVPTGNPSQAPPLLDNSGYSP